MKNRAERKPLEYYLGLRYPITLIPEAEGGYTVMLRDLPGCVSVGETLEEAMAMTSLCRQPCSSTLAWCRCRLGTVCTCICSRGFTFQ